MPPIIVLNPQQIADLYGALDDFVGTGDNINAIFNTAFFPVVVEKNLTDDLIGLGDNLATAYSTNFFCDSPRTIQNLKLYRTSVTDPLNELTIVTHYAANTTTGAITLTPAGVTFLGLETLHAAYLIPSTVELHTGTIAGPLLVEVTDYTIAPRTGEIELTASGITALGLSQLHAAYYTEKGSINFIDEDSAGMGSGRVQLRIRKREVSAKDQDLRAIHEAIFTVAITHLEEERKQLAGTYVLPSEEITESVMEANVKYAYRTVAQPGVVAPGGDPLFPGQFTGLPANPQLPDLTALGLNGGSGLYSGAENSAISGELAQRVPIFAAGGDFAGPLGWDARYAAAGPLLGAIATQQTALTAQIAAITLFLAANNDPLGNDHVFPPDLTQATAASAAATLRHADNVTYLALVNTPPHSGLSNAQIDNIPPGIRYTANLARQTAILARQTAILVTLGDPDRLWDRRKFWIVERVRLGDGTLAVVDNATKGDIQIGTQLSQNAERRQNILDIILAQ
jgi:hypothetical protein